MASIEEFLPRYQFREHHARIVAAGADAAFAQLRHVDLALSPWIGPLFALRSLPARFARGGAALEALQPTTLGDFFGRAFTPLAERPGRCFVIGSVGRFWQSSGGIEPVTPDSFTTNATPGCARLAWAFDFEPLGEDRCRVSTETRIACNDAAARWRMQLYWWAIRPASGLIRREILRLLAARCEMLRDT
jgi:hypothetical protein